MANQADRKSLAANPPPVYIASGGVGASGEQLVYTVLAQFPETQVPVFTVGNVRHLEQIQSVLRQAKDSGGIIVHTLVDSNLRDSLIQGAEEQGVIAIDLMGALLEKLEEVLGQKSQEKPGLYRQLHKAYFDRVAAMEFTMAHDDGKDPQGWSQAEIVIIGVSRTGKTPLSLYLSILGWKIANTPIVPGVPAPAELFRIDRDRIIGLTMEPGQLLMHRKQRQSRLGVTGPSDYTNPVRIYEEVEEALSLFRQHGFTVVDVTDKPIETSADEIIRLITRRTSSY